MLDKQYFLRWVGLLAEWKMLVQNQFNLTASAAGMYVGGVSVVAGGGGTLLGGLTVKKLGLRVRGLLKIEDDLRHAVRGHHHGHQAGGAVPAPGDHRARGQPRMLPRHHRQHLPGGELFSADFNFVKQSYRIHSFYNFCVMGNNKIQSFLTYRSGLLGIGTAKLPLMFVLSR